MKTLRFFALLLILALSFSLLTSCEILDGIMGNTPECEHEWVDGKCSICSTVCDHDFDPEDNYACIFCGDADNIVFFNGKRICQNCLEEIKNKL